MDNDSDIEKIVGVGVGTVTGGFVTGAGDGGEEGVPVGASLGTRGQYSLLGGPRSD